MKVSATLPIPNLATASDQEIESLFPSFDGRWSAQTKALLAQHGAERLDLDDNWASVPPTWRCGPCGRYKAELARLSEAGVLICRLDWHHDHLRDHGKRVLKRDGSRPSEPEAFRRWFGAVEACKDLIERFHPSFVCVDCNAADGDAKRRLKGIVHPEFSFSPAEIAAFITVQPGRSHKVDVEKAEAIWKLVEDDVLDRISFTDLLAERVAKGRHQRQGRKHWSEPPLGPLLRDMSRNPIYPARMLLQLPADLSARSLQKDGFRSSLKSKVQPVRVPSRAEFDAFTAAQDPRSPWVRHDADWACPSCDRSRFECLRASGKGKWTGRLHRLHVYQDEDDDDALRWRNGWDEGGLTYRTHADVYLCQDCRLVITDTNKGLKSPSEDCLKIDDLRALVGGAAPHTRPEVDLEAALTLAEENFEHAEAARIYWHHRCTAVAVLGQYDHLTKWRGADRETAMWIVLEKVGRYDLEGEELPGMLDFMLAEGARFSAEGEALRSAQRAGGTGETQ
ncbi:hypothetical protein [Brevundimonas pondensis]|uniref:Uncharacterized protein n=1 Tax=Brevundimonas pondensis TaxID=2774189 RepID=A0ABX7SNP2_9CAUL|nr:hypothetical protein [Brevundimonas pondensis]QTC88415.1 hypothetical protein IFE19_03210 [Brevundimonas pondensis]